MLKFEMLILFSLFIVKILCYKCVSNVKSEPEFYLISMCHRSKFKPLYTYDSTSLEQCNDLALKNRAMAFNYSPLERNVDVSKNLESCIIFACPEIENSVSFVQDFAFDYYSMFTFPIPPPNSTCIDGVGIFVFHMAKSNYTKAQQICRDLGAELADVGTELKTTEISKMISSLSRDYGRNKMFYVGIDDLEIEGDFKRANGESIKCSTYRAWAPGHPKNKRKTQNCVTLDLNNMWYVVDCNKKYPFVCEIYPNGLNDYVTDYEIFDCEN